MSEVNFRILFYAPNIIGYLRLGLTAVAFWQLSSLRPCWFVVLYAISITLDGVDGFLARKLQQCSSFGAWLDVVVDNVSRGLLWSHIHPLCSLISALEWAVFVCNHRLGTAWRQQLAGTQHSSPVTTEDKRHPLHSRTDVGHDTPLTTGNSMCYTNESRKALLNDYQVHHTQGMNNNVNYFENDSSINGYGSSKQQPALVHWVMKNNFRSIGGVLAIAGLHVLPLWLAGIKYDVFSQSLAFLPASLPSIGVVLLVLGRVLCGVVECWSIWLHIALLLSAHAS